MVRGLFGVSCLIVAGGCVALNSGFEEGAAGTGGGESSDTGQRTASASDSDPSASGGGSAVTTVTVGESSGGGTSDPTDSSGPPSGESGHSSGSSGGDWTGTSAGESGGVVCEPASAVVTDDAFLRTCFDGSCSSLNYGQTGFGSLADAAEPSVLLLRIPVPALSADRVEVTLHLLAELGAPASAFTLTAFAIDSPCVWNEGPHDGDSLNPGEPGVTHQACNGDPDAGISWGDSGKANVFDHIDSGWSIGQQTFVGGEIADGELFSATIVLDRLVDGPTPDALVITSSATALNELFVFTSEDELEPPVVEVVSHCR